MALKFIDTVNEQLEEDDRLRADTLSWWRWRRGKEEVPLAQAFMSIFAEFSEFRSLAYYRFTKASANTDTLAFKHLANDLWLVCDDIGGGLRIQHGSSTYLHAEKVGQDCHINQNVTVGSYKGKKPVIGNRVTIYTGAVITGGAVIGDDVVIAPNAFVNFDVPAGKKVLAPRSIIK